MLADLLTKTMEITAVQRRLFYENEYALVPTPDELETEAKRKDNRTQQRQRAKERKKERRDESFRKSQEERDSGEPASGVADKWNCCLVDYDYSVNCAPL